MANKELAVHTENRDFTGRLNLFVQTNPALMSVVIAVILAFTLVCLLTGNINPVCRVTAMLMPVWLAAELRLLCTLL